MQTTEPPKRDVVIKWGRRNPAVDRERRRLLRESEKLVERGLIETEKLLRDYLTAMLSLTHERLVAGRIDLPRYYKDTEMLAYCIERLNKLSDGNE